tara:strand:- start:8173 stop:8898 length:726 start_codon:yes stop_codon:yes gene_type:complete
MFFDSQPNFLYPDFKNKDDYKVSKNFFRRLRSRDNFNSIFSSSLPYTVTPGETVEQVSYKKFNDSKWYWTILLMNNIIDIRREWPLSSNELEDYMDNKYGTSIDNTRHWETNKVTDTTLGTVLEQGVIVEFYEGTTAQQTSNYVPQIQNESGSAVNWTFKYFTQSGGSPNTQVENIVPASTGLTKVTNREWEYEENEKKREIIIPRQQYLSILEDELESLLKYETKYKITKSGLRISEPYQ